MSDFFLGYITGIGALFNIWSVGYAVRFFIERGFRVSFGMIIIVLIPLLNSVLAMLYFKEGDKR